jgi:hypothetical protein
LLLVDYRHLVEARIRDFRQRTLEGRTKPAPESTGGESLEATLMSEIRELRKQAREAKDEEKMKSLLAEAQKLETQLMVLLESTGRPLAARLIADRLRATEDDTL